ncbi:MAG: phenylacetic acid catabolic [Alphaproteobacteria bacterium]|nr:phenylacetic acid catabolic [Alphaproteobacteria bacterium]
MHERDAALVKRIADGAVIAAPEDVSPGYRAEIMRLMVVLVDSELAGAAGFAEQINHAPGMRERVTAARIVAEKFAHAEIVLELLRPFGVNPELYVKSHAWNARINRAVDLGMRRSGGDKRLNVFHYPLEGWIDAIAMNMLMGSASSIQLAELLDCSYKPLADAMAEIVGREAEHASLGEIGLVQAIDRDANTTPAQGSVDYWYRRVAHTFGRTDSDRFELYRDFGLRRHSNSEMLDAWKDDVAPRLVKLGLEVPAAVQ